MYGCALCQILWRGPINLLSEQKRLFSALKLKASFYSTWQQHNCSSVITLRIHKSHLIYHKYKNYIFPGITLWKFHIQCDQKENCSRISMQQTSPVTPWWPAWLFIGLLEKSNLSNRHFQKMDNLWVYSMELNRCFSFDTILTQR